MAVDSDAAWINPASINMEFRICVRPACGTTVVFVGGEAAGDLAPGEWASAACPGCGTVQGLTCASLGKPARQPATASPVRVPAVAPDRFVAATREAFGARTCS